MNATPHGTRVAATPVLLYDGECGLCARSVQFVLRHESSPVQRARLRFAPLQGAFGARVRSHHAELAVLDSVVWYETGEDGPTRVLVRSAAALAVLSHLGGRWRVLAVIGRMVPRPLRDRVYDVIARHRLAWVSPACLLPSEDERGRFLP